MFEVGTGSVIVSIFSALVLGFVMWIIFKITNL